MPWRLAYALLGLLGIVVAIAIFIFTPRLPPELPAAQEPSAQDTEAAAKDAGLHYGFYILAAFGIADSVVRGAFFVLLPFVLIGKGGTVVTAGRALTLVFVGGAAGKFAYG
jgi:MFS transporter, FSR family, fosmidomycin resistance protein